MTLRPFNRAAVVLVAALFVATLSSPSVVGSRASGPETYVLPVRLSVALVRPDLEQTAVGLLNRERARLGLPSLSTDWLLHSAALGHGRDMLAHGYFSHRSRDGRGPLDRMAEAGANARIVGENLAFAASVREAHRALMKSPGHRKNILYPSFRRVGVAVVGAGRYGVIVVQNFSD